MPSNEATISEAQQTANRANAQKSTGPRTPEGKARAKMNALRHGMTGQFYVLSDDDRSAYLAYETNLLAALAPVGAYERDLAISITQNRWRLNRARAMECNIQGLAQHDLADHCDTTTPEVEVAIAQAQTWLNSHQALANMTLYENRIRRDVARDKKELDELQAARKTAEAQARDEAELLLAHAVMKKEPLTAKAIHAHGFEFSTTALHTSLTHKAALAAARFCQKNNWDIGKPGPNTLLFHLQEPLAHPKAA